SSASNHGEMDISGDPQWGFEIAEELMKFQIGLITFLLGLATTCGWSENLSTRLIVWNVGQGQWVTLTQPQHCLHFDFGGEWNPIRRVLRHCQGKMNFLYLSHFDWDHRSFMTSILENFRHVCRAGIPKTKNQKRVFQFSK